MGLIERDEQITALVDGIHAENLGGEHRDGFCRACAYTYLVVQRALPGRPGGRIDQGAVEDAEKLAAYARFTLLQHPHGTLVSPDELQVIIDRYPPPTREEVADG